MLSKQNGQEHVYVRQDCWAESLTFETVVTWEIKSRKFHMIRLDLPPLSGPVEIRLNPYKFNCLWNEGNLVCLKKLDHGTKSESTVRDSMKQYDCLMVSGGPYPLFATSSTNMP